MEQHFLDLWKPRNDFFDLMVISGTREAGDETLGNLQRGEMVKDDTRYQRLVYPGGFGAALGGGDLRSFLHSPAST